MRSSRSLSAPTIRRNPRSSEQLIRSYIHDVFERRRLDLLPRYVDPNIIVHLPYYTSRLKGQQAYESFIKQFLIAFPVASIKIEDIVATDNKVALRWKVTGKYCGDFMHLPESDRPVTLHVMSFYHIVDGKIKEAWRTDTGFWILPDF